MLAMGTFIKLLIYVNIDSFNYIIFAQNKTTICIPLENNLISNLF